MSAGMESAIFDLDGDAEPVQDGEYDPPNHAGAGVAEFLN
jgi:hypothetical protein